MFGDSHFSETIERLLDKFLAESGSDPTGLRQIASGLHVLPLALDMGGCIAVCPSGEIISFGWETPDDVRLEANVRLQNMALYQGSLKYAALREFIPARSTDAIDCPHCQEISELKKKTGRDNFVCYCGGLGWLPPGELECMAQ